MSGMYIGSGDVTALLSGKGTEAHQKLLRRFVSGEVPYYNALASPIDACRTGAILEGRYLLTLPEDYFTQVKVTCGDMDVFRCSLDFARIDKGEVVDFDELKSVSISDFIEINSIEDYDGLLAFVRKKYKHYYNQVQEQLYCTGLEEANLVFLCVYSYDDEENYLRDIQPNEVLKVRIGRDEEVISFIKERGRIFQQIKDCYEDVVV